MDTAGLYTYIYMTFICENAEGVDFEASGRMEI